MPWLDSYPGTFVTQSVLHSFVALLVVETAIVIWEMDNHLDRFRHRLIIIIAPILMYPVFQLAFPSRGGFFFREDLALFDSARWFRLDVRGVAAGAWLFVGILAFSTAVMVVQELVPVMRRVLTVQKGVERTAVALPCVQGIVDDLANRLNLRPPPIRVVDDDFPCIFTTGARNPSLVLSTGLLETLNKEELRSALAHELAHVLRDSNLTTFVVYLVRLLMFYNPVSLLVFRRLVQDDEHVCDDITVSLTGDGRALAGALKVFMSKIAEIHHGMREMAEALEDHSHNLLLEERVARLSGEASVDTRPSGPGSFALTLAVVLCVSFFVV